MNNIKNPEELAYKIPTPGIYIHRMVDEYNLFYEKVLDRIIYAINFNMKELTYDEVISNKYIIKFKLTIDKQFLSKVLINDLIKYFSMNDWDIKIEQYDDSFEFNLSPL